MKVVIAIDSFKNCMSSSELGEVIKKAIKDVDNTIEVCSIPVSDGGENTVENLVINTSGILKKVKSKDAMQRDIDSKIGFNKAKTIAYIDMASASGIEFIKEEEKNPCIASTRGMGILIKEALKEGVKEIILGIGSSATNDLGLGMFQELGMKLYDKDKKEIVKEEFNILEVKSFDIQTIDERVKNLKITLATDVSNFLLGNDGATYIFSKQKGATEEMMYKIEENFILLNDYCKSKYNIDLNTIEGGGSGGGITASMSGFLNAKVVSGLELIISMTNLEEEIKTADLVITGEGYMDEQSIYGKVPVGIAKLSKKYNVKVIALCGGSQQGVENLYDTGIDGIFPIITKPQTLEEAINDVNNNLYFTTYNLIKILKQ